MSFVHFTIAHQRNRIFYSRIASIDTHLMFVPLNQVHDGIHGSLPEAHGTGHGLVWCDDVGWVVHRAQAFVHPSEVRTRDEADQWELEQNSAVLN